MRDPYTAADIAADVYSRGLDPDRVDYDRVGAYQADGLSREEAAARECRRLQKAAQTWEEEFADYEAALDFGHEQDPVPHGELSF